MIEDRYKNKDGMKYPHPKSASIEETNYKMQLYGWNRKLKKRRRKIQLANISKKLIGEKNE